MTKQGNRFSLRLGVFFIFTLGLAIGLVLNGYRDALVAKVQPAPLKSQGYFYTGGTLPGGQWPLPMTVSEAVESCSKESLPIAGMELVVLRKSPNGGNLELSIDVNSQAETKQQLNAGDTLILRQSSSDGPNIN